MFRISPSYRKPLLIALAFHVALILAMLMRMPSVSYRMPGPVSKRPIVHAKTVDASQVNKVMDNIKAREAAKRKQEQARLRKLQQAALAAKRARIREQKRLAVLKQKQVAAKKAAVRAAKQKALALKRKKALALKLKAAKLAKQKKLKLQKAQVLQAKKLKTLKAKALQKEQAALAQKLMAQQLKKDQQQLSSLHARQVAGEIDKYKAGILQAIGQNWLVPGGASKQLSCQFLINVAPGGVVLNVKLLKSSGDQALDRSAQVAIFKASPLPVPKNPSLFDNFRELRLTVSPKQIL